MYRLIRHRGWLSILFLIYACGMPKTRFYTMELPHVGKSPGPAIGHHLAVQRFRADQILMDDRILYRENATEVNFYQYHRWASPPADLVTQYFLHRLKDSSAYSRVTPLTGNSNADLILQGRLHRFEEVDQGKEVSVALSLELELLDGKTRAPVWREETECTRPVASHDMAGVVQGLYACMDEVSARLLGSMQERLRQAN